MQMSITNRAIVPARGQVFLNERSTLTAHFGSISWVNYYKLTTSFCRFVRQHLSKLIPRSICSGYTATYIHQADFAEGVVGVC
jgi:hypothetical protein